MQIFRPIKRPFRRRRRSSVVPSFRISPLVTGVSNGVARARPITRPLRSLVIFPRVLYRPIVPIIIGSNRVVSYVFRRFRQTSSRRRISLLNMRRYCTVL